MFSIQPSGFAGTLMPEFIEIIELVNQDRCEDIFAAMAKGDSEYEQKLYALVGLKLIKSNLFDEIANNLSCVDEMVQFSNGGCCFSPRHISDVVKYIKEVDLSRFLD